MFGYRRRAADHRLPVAFALAALACFSIMDKTNGTIVLSGVTRRYLLYVPKS